MRHAFDQPDPDNVPNPKGWVEWLNKPKVPEAFELELGGHSKSILSICFAKDNRTLLSGSADGTIRVWDSQTGELCTQLENHQGPVTCVRLSPDGTIMASASADKTIRLWRFPANECFRFVTEGVYLLSCWTLSKDDFKESSVFVFHSERSKNRGYWCCFADQAPVILRVNRVTQWITQKVLVVFIRWSAWAILWSKDQRINPEGSWPGHRPYS